MKIEIPPGLEKYKFFLFPIIVTVFSVLILIFVIIPQIYNLFNLSSKMDETNKKITSLTQKINNLNQIDRDLYKVYIDQMLIALPFDKDIPQSLSQVQFAAASTNLQIVGLDVANESTAINGALSYSIQLEVIGTLSDLKRFFNRFDEAPRVIRLAGYELTTSKDSSVYSGSVKLTTFFSPQPTTLGAIDTPVEGLSAADITLLTKIEQLTEITPIISVTGSTTPGKTNPFE
ncbi:type 4a pilus biogenesis protein PilO [Candidatus Daviesbacteria bacterium]|nr:type 4a pilus biogenesis protein PilO [Candidatus Daviesbacteria bacterium]